MARGNPNPKIEHLPKQKANWNNLPTEVARVPKIFLEEILGFARSLDGQCSPFEAIISVLNKLSPDELAQIKLAIECLSDGELVEVKGDTSGNLKDKRPVVSQEAQLSDAEIAAYTASSAVLSFAQVEQLREKFGFVPSRYQLAMGTAAVMLLRVQESPAHLK
jgi:DNA helicase II / ATP-dependent DNA helicase PcrA